MGKKILVKGNIIQKRYFEYADLAAYYSFNNESDFNSIINGDLVIDDDYKEDYITTLYFATGEICSYDIWDGKEDPNYRLREYYNQFFFDLQDVKALLNTRIEGYFTRNALLRLLYINIWGAIETFLFRLINNMVLADIQYMESLKSYKCFISFCSKNKKEIKGDGVKEYLGKIIYHRLDDVNRLYKKVIGIKIDKKRIYKYLKKRHDFIHRNGITKEEQNVSILDVDVLNFMLDAECFIENIVDKTYIRKD